VAVEEIHTMNRDELLATLNAYRTIEAQCKELISYYELELRKLDFAEDLKSDQDSGKI
jgi:hypothetical protein